MPPVIPFIPSRNNYRLTLPLSGTRYIFDNVHWNSRDLAWYFDLREEDEVPIVLGLKVVLGARIGGRSPHPFFSNHILQALDTTCSSRDAGFDDLGARVIVVVTTVDDVVAFKG